MKILLLKSWFKRNLTGIFVLCMFMPMMPHGCSTTGSHQKHRENAIDVGNKICPVSGEKVDKKSRATYKYKDRIYNFCCSICVNEFKKDPPKYTKNIEKENKQEGYHTH